MRPRRSAALLPAAVIVAFVLTAVPALPAAAAEGDSPSVTISDISPTTVDGAITEPFTVEVEVNLNGAPWLSLNPLAGTPGNTITSEPQTIDADHCPTVCTVTFDFDPTGWETPLPPDWGSIGIYFYSDAGSSSAQRSVYFANPVANTFITAVNRDPTDNVAGYAPWVLDTGGDFTIGSDIQRSAGEVLEARVYPAGSGLPRPAPILTATGSWSQPPAGGQPPTGSIHLDTANLAAGSYPMMIRARNLAGQYGWSLKTSLTVRHDPITSMSTFPAYLGPDQDLVVGMVVNRPLPDGITYSNFSVSIDGGPAQTVPAQSWQVPAGTLNPVTGFLRLHPALAPGDHTVTVQVLDTHGNPIGSPSTGTVTRVEFTDTAAITPPLVVGRPGSVEFTGTAPLGLTYQTCSYMLVDPELSVAGNACESGQSTYSKPVNWTPLAAGPGHVDTWVRTEQGAFSPVQTIPLTIYAARSVLLTAPSVSAYGSHQTATVTVRDLHRVGGIPLAAANVAVRVQRQAAGTTDWSDLATALTDTTGRAFIAFDNTVNGQLRALVTSTVPGENVVSATQPVSTAATVSWISLPKWSRSGALIRARVLTLPYQSGAAIRVQARHRGSRWKPVGSALVTASGYTKATFRLARRTTWQIRILRTRTSNTTAAYSSIRRISIR